MPNDERIAKAVYAAVDELNEQLPAGVHVDKALDAPLYGSTGKLESLSRRKARCRLYIRQAAACFRLFPGYPLNKSFNLINVKAAKIVSNACIGKP